MPTVLLFAQEEWLPHVLPDGLIDQDASATAGNATAQYEAMDTLLSSVLVRMVVEAIEYAEELINPLRPRSQVGDRNVMILPQHFHRWAINTPDLLVDFRYGGPPQGRVRQSTHHRAAVEYLAEGLRTYFLNLELHPHLIVTGGSEASDAGVELNAADNQSRNWGGLRRRR